MRIGLDVDGVIYQWDRTARYMLREVLPNSPYKDKYELKGWDLYQESSSWHCIQNHISKEHWDWLWTEGVRLGLFRYGHLFPGSIQAVRELATLGDVVLITHRPKQAVDDTLAWLGYLKLPLSGVHLLTNGENKSTARPHCDVYLDDKVQNVNELARGTKGQVFLMKRPWSSGYVEHDVVTVHGWGEFLEEVKGIHAS
jgi:uncharacterized HAD superfamily protein